MGWYFVSQLLLNFKGPCVKYDLSYSSNISFKQVLTHRPLTAHEWTPTKVVIKQNAQEGFIVPEEHDTFWFVCKRKRKRSDPVLWQKPPTPTEQSKKQRDNIKTPPKTLITELLRTDLGRSVGVTAVTQLMWLNRFTSAQPSH